MDKADRPGTTSRALAVQARTLEFYRQLGIADKIVPQGVLAKELQLLRRGKLAARVEFGAVGEGMSPFPYLLFLSQDVHEEILGQELARLGVEIERSTALVGFKETSDGVFAQLQASAGEEEVESEYLVGCDGAHSAVRRGMGLDFPGGTYSQVFFVADVEAKQKREDVVQVSVSPADFCILMPIKQKKSIRLTGLVPPEHETKAEITYTDVGEAVKQNVGIDVTKVNWFSTYRVHHRVVDHFRKGRAFLAGDAAHIHSPAGGQGMNTGIGDAINLAWKLADVLKHGASKKVLDSYEPERLGFARILVSTTDQAFRVIANRSWLGGTVRTYVIPMLFARLVKLRAVARFMFRTISQIRIQYRNSPMSGKSLTGVQAGDRLPWMSYCDNFAPLASLDWQVHVYGALDASCANTGLPLHRFPWNQEAGEKGIQKGAFYLVRPDGYVAAASMDPLKLAK